MKKIRTKTKFAHLKGDMTYPVVLRFPHRQPRDVAVPAAPLVLWVLLHELASPEIGAIEGNLELVRLAVGLQLPRDIDPLGDEHVVRLKNDVAIEAHGGEGVETLKGQDGLRRGRAMGGAEGSAVGPGALADPLDVELVLADEGVGDDLVVDEVEVNVGGELGDGEVGGLRVVDLLELPALVKRRHRATRHLELRLGHGVLEFFFFLFWVSSRV